MSRLRDLDHIYVWNDLEGKIAPAILCAPRTGGDPSGKWSHVDARGIRYLVRNVVGNPWGDFLTLFVAILSAQRRDVATVEHQLQSLHTRFSSLFSFFELDDICQWSVDRHLVPYVQGEILFQDSLSARVDFFKMYMGASNLVAAWFGLLPVAQQDEYRPFLLPTINPFVAETLNNVWREVDQQRRDHRKEETEAVVPEFTTLRAEAHFRYNRMKRLQQAYHLNNAGWGCERDGHVWDGSIWGRHAEEDRREHDLCGLVMIRFSLLWGGSRPLSPRGT